MSCFTYSGSPPRWRRPIFFTLVILTALFAVTLLASVYQKDGLSPLEIALLILYAILMAWISFSFWAAVIGFILQIRDSDRFAISNQVAPLPLDGEARVALVMPVYNEDPRRVFAGLESICLDLLRNDAQSHFDLFILSDTRDPELWIEEELRWQKLNRTLQGKIQIFYRNRKENSARKVGNIKDYIHRWGGAYRYTLILDADSVMRGDTLLKMLRIMEANPKLALLQVPPAPVGKESLFARILQFASSVYGPIFTAGLNYWQMAEGNYWGHNAIFRTRAFSETCGLPRLPGEEPFGGEIFSHDFIEAAMLRRAGWQVWLAYDMTGSYEELPPTLIDYAKRDRRWCQGNLQHTKLFFAKGWHPINRLHLGMGIMSYLASPLWMLFLVLTGVDAYLRSQQQQVYFFGHYTLFPTWPETYSVEMGTVLVVTLVMLFLPKILAITLLLTRPEQLKEYGGALRATLSVLLETVISVLLAPVLMLFQSKFVVAILLRSNINWATQQRDDHQTGLLDAMAAHAGHTLLGLTAAWVSYYYVNNFFWWLIPVLLGMVLSIPLSMVLSNLNLGKLLHKYRFCLIPEESNPPYVLQQLHRLMQQKDPLHLAEQSRFSQVLIDPPIHALHLSMLPSGSNSKRQQHHLSGLIYQLLEEGEESLTIKEKRALLSDRDALRKLHLTTWSLPALDGDFGRVVV
ncbi:MAG: glucans biosynthesis glucosyltransferase MdoH [Gammaproteobacteria bacterium]|nr:glucans biosynthesis glucosyltransferase MdoH [Gammaproteobacteria bacterium]